MDLHYTGRPNHGALIRAVTIADEDGDRGEPVGNAVELIGAKLG